MEKLSASPTLCEGNSPVTIPLTKACDAEHAGHLSRHHDHYGVTVIVYESVENHLL